MVGHIIPAGGFYSNSPEIRISRNPAVDDTVKEAKRWIQEQAERGGSMNCQLLPDSDEVRDGHLTRLIGVKKMHAMLLELRGKTKYFLIYHKMKKPWCVPDNEHPCAMLATSDKWWMSSWNDWKLNRYGQQRREKETCVPPQLREKWYKFSVEYCKYCNGEYNNRIRSAPSQGIENAST